MPYSLRPGAKLKRPARYKSESDEEVPPNPSRLASSDGAVAENLLNASMTILAGEASRHDSPITSQLKTPQPSTAPLKATPQHPSASQQQIDRTMAKVKHVTRKSPPEDGEVNARRRSATAQTTQPAQNLVHRPAYNLIQRQAPKEDVSLFPTTGPAAFPSFPTDILDLPTIEEGHFGIKRRMVALEKNDQAAISQIIRQVKQMYSNEAFPADLDAAQKEWYIELKKRMPSATGSEEQIRFITLYPSLRQTIIEQIRDSYPFGHFHTWYHPVLQILQLSRHTLDDILAENSEIWTEIPEHLLRYKKAHPNEAVDPDTPPQEGVVLAIRFLVQIGLPGSLLGEWQMGLPDVELFRPPIMFPSPLKPRIGAGGGE